MKTEVKIAPNATLSVEVDDDEIIEDMLRRQDFRPILIRLHRALLGETSSYLSVEAREVRYRVADQILAILRELR